MSPIRKLISAVMAGVCIAVSGAACLNSDSTIAQALVSCFGYIAIFSFGFGLFSTRVCYALNKSKWYNFDLVIFWVGNLIGAIVTGLLFMLSGLAPGKEIAAATLQQSLDKGAVSHFILAFFCGMLICFAYEIYNRLDDRVERLLAMCICIAAFVIPGFEHFLTNAFYIAVSGEWSGKAIGFLLLATIGNAAGGIALMAIKNFTGMDYED